MSSSESTNPNFNTEGFGKQTQRNVPIWKSRRVRAYASRVLGVTALYSLLPAIMPQPTEFELTVPTEDPKKPEKKDSEKTAFEGLSKLDDSKESEDMVRHTG